MTQRGDTDTRSKYSTQNEDICMFKKMFWNNKEKYKHVSYVNTLTKGKKGKKIWLSPPKNLQVTLGKICLGCLRSMLCHKHVVIEFMKCGSPLLKCAVCKTHSRFFCFSFCFVLFCLFRATPATYGGSQARGKIRAIATGLCHSHSNVGSELCLGPTPQLTATPDP